MKKGFTLIELIVVIAIVAVLALILVPQVTGYIHNTQETVCVANFKTLETEYQLVAINDTDLNLVEYLDSLSDDEKNICPLCPIISTDGGTIVCKGENAEINNTSDMSDYDNKLYQQYLADGGIPSTEEYQKYILEMNGGSFYVLNEQQKQEIMDSGLANSGMPGRLTSDYFDNDLYYRPVVVDGKTVIVITEDSSSSLNTVGFYCDDQFYYYVHGYGHDLYEGGAFHHYKWSSESEAIQEIIAGVENGDGYFDIGNTRGWTIDYKD